LLDVQEWTFPCGTCEFAALFSFLLFEILRFSDLTSPLFFVSFYYSRPPLELIPVLPATGKEVLSR